MSSVSSQNNERSKSRRSTCRRNKDSASTSSFPTGHSRGRNLFRLALILFSLPSSSLCHPSQSEAMRTSCSFSTQSFSSGVGSSGGCTSNRSNERKNDVSREMSSVSSQNNERSSSRRSTCRRNRYSTSTSSFPTGHSRGRVQSLLPSAHPFSFPSSSFPPPPSSLHPFFSASPSSLFK